MSKPKKKGIFTKIRIFLVGKTDKDLIPDEWITPDSTPPDPELGKKETKPLKIPKIALPDAAKDLIGEFGAEKEKFRFPGLRRGKRLIAFILFLISVSAIYGSIVVWQPAFIVLMFLNSAIMLDYLLKTQPKKNKKFYVVEE